MQKNETKFQSFEMRFLLSAIGFLLIVLMIVKYIFVMEDIIFDVPDTIKQ